MENNRNRYYPKRQYKPKKTNTGIQYISKENNCYRVSYQRTRKGFKTLELAEAYLEKLKKGLECHYRENG